MKALRRLDLRLTSGVLLAMLGMFAAAQVAQAGFDFDEKGNPFCTGQALVTFKKGLNPLTVRSVIARQGGDPGQVYWFDTIAKFMAKKGKATAGQKALADELARTAWLTFDDRKDVLSFCQSMKADKGNVTEASPNHIGDLCAVPNDFFYGVQWGVRPITKTDSTLGNVYIPNGTIGNFPNAWDMATGAGVKIAVLDTGCDLTHPDLVSKIVFWSFAAGCASGWPPGPRNLPITAPATEPWDQVGHGTMVAGVIGAQWKNKIGITGAAPNCQLMIIKVTNLATVSPTVAALTDGINQAVANGANIINMSLHAGIVHNVALQTAIVLAQTLNVIPIAALGNYTPGANPVPTPPPYPVPPAAANVITTVPAAYPGVIAVGAHPQRRETAYGWRGRYSYITPAVTLLGPGGGGTNFLTTLGVAYEDIFSTWPRYALPYTQITTLGIPGGIVPGYAFMGMKTTTVGRGIGGTSFGAAHVSGATALLRQRLPWFTPAQVLARHIRFADRADLPAVTNWLGAATQTQYPSARRNPYDAIFYPSTTAGSRVNTSLPQLTPNPPYNPYLGYGLLDAFRLLQGVSESPGTNSSLNVTKGMPTGYVRIFPWSPRDHHWTLPGQPVSGETLFNGVLRPYEFPIPTAGANLNLRAIMVDDQGNLLTGRNPQLIAYIYPTTAIPQSITVYNPLPTFISLKDDGLAADLVANDGIYAGSFFLPAAYAPGGISTYSLRIQYVGNATGLLQNTNCVIHVRM